MKSTHFLFTMIGCAVLTHGIGYADPSSATTAQPPSGNRGSVVNKTVINQAVRPSSAVPPTGTSPKIAGNRGPGPAVIGGPANLTKNTAVISGKSANPTKNTMAINGTGMKRKH
jgi:hypothetical protein